MTAPGPANPDERDLDKNPGNYAPLTPLTFIERAAHVYPDRLGVIHGTRRFTWAETYARCRRLASALARRGIGVDVDDPEHTGPGARLGQVEYEAFIASGDPAFPWRPPANE